MNVKNFTLQIIKPFFVKMKKTYVTENKIRIQTFYRASVVNKILVLEVNIFHLAYLWYILHIYKMSSNDEK